MPLLPVARSRETADRRAAASPASVWWDVAGGAAAVALANLAVLHLCLTPRAWLLFSAGDSVLPALVRASLSAGEPQHWALSAVLFLPEAAVYAALVALGLGVRAAFTVNAVLNLLVLWAALRFVAGSVPDLRRRERAVGALLGFGLFTGLTALDSSPAWDSAELPSLLMTTTYYSATVIALVLLAGLAVRLVVSTEPARRRRSVAALVIVSAVSTLSNPLSLGWTTAPTLIALLVLAGRGLLPWATWARAAGVFGAGTTLGLLGRIPFAPFIARDSTAYADPGQAVHVLFGYYLRLLLERVVTPLGAVSTAVAAALLLLSVVLLVRGIRGRDLPLAVLAGMGVASPVLTAIGAIALGTHAYRYLQPAFVAPLLPLVLAARGVRVSIRLRKGALLGATAVAAVVAVVGAAGLVTATSSTDGSIECLDRWITASHRVGAGRFLAIRGPKAYLAHPAQLLQVDTRFREYDWLVNRADYRVRAVSFVVSTSDVPAPTVPATAVDPTVLHCGRYTVQDFGSATLPIGAPAPDALP